MPAPDAPLDWTPALLRERSPAALRPSDVHLFRFSLDAPPDGAEALLSSDERARAARYHFDRDRLAFLTARAQLRRLLAPYLGVPPETITFSTTGRDKPCVAGSPVRFNLSHAGGLGLLGVSLGELGVDVEVAEPLPDLDSVAERHFSAFEIARYRARPPAARVGLFYKLWTRKEAYVKALGDGLYAPLDDFDVLAGDDDSPKLRTGARSTGQTVARGGPWQLCDVPIDEGYAAALVLQSTSPPEVRRFSA